MAKRATAKKAADVVSIVPRETIPVRQVEQWPLERLKPYARNSRTHSKDQVAKIAASIQRFGFTNPVLATTDGTIVAGHGRRMAAASLRMATVPVIVCDGWSPNDVKAYVIADNKLALDAGWDEDILKLELGDLGEAGFDLELTGFGEEDLNQLFGRVAEDVNGGSTPPAITESFQILIACKGEAEQLALLEELQKRGIECRALIS